MVWVSLFKCTIQYEFLAMVYLMNVIQTQENTHEKLTHQKVEKLYITNTYIYMFEYIYICIVGLGKLTGDYRIKVLFT